PVPPPAAPAARQEHRNGHHQQPQQPHSSHTNGTQRPGTGHRVAAPSPAGASEATVWDQVNTASAPRLFAMITIPLTVVVGVMLMVLDGRL
ncbi:hypothetical protein, partial [Streptomyces albidus (ex Kaewkla and Franco 2022)]|uniref:hypothetical protein n=1 Tax=Streptomyces albidus (ex Kaewkla and Franco 2022) TaxID=722709 RepID=UPI001B3577A8